MKMPNGYGSVVKLYGKRRNKYAVRITVGITPTGKRIRKYIGYVKSREEGFEMLSKYYSDPYDVDLKTITFKQLYDLWLPEKKKELSKTSVYRYSSNLHYYTHLFNTPFLDITYLNLQQILEQVSDSYEKRRNIKTLYKQLYKYAKIIGVPVIRDNSEFLPIGSRPTNSDMHSNFTKQEIKLLWEKKDNNIFISALLIMIYTGMRPGEVVSLEEVNVKERYLIGGIKTKAGKHRKIPICEKIVPLVERYIESGELSKMSARYLSEKVNKELKELNLNHLAYDGRHTFATLTDNAGINPLVIKIIMGHRIDDITKGVYTHKNFEQLLEAVNII